MTAARTYRDSDWIDTRVEVRASAIAGLGAFTTAPIEAGEVVFVWGGELFRAADLAAAEPHATAAVDEGLFLGPPRGATRSAASYTNHSCDPTLWLTDDVTVVARRDLGAGDELTLDYATFEPNEEFVLLEACRCGSRLCRGRVTGRDWRLPALRQRYVGHLSPFLARRTAAERRER